SAKARRPCRRQASARSSRAASPGSPWLFVDDCARSAIDPAHRIDHLTLGAVHFAFDLRVEPTARPAAIDDSSRKFERGVFEREDLVVAFVRGVDGFANQLERLRLAPRSERDVVDAIGPGLD